MKLKDNDKKTLEQISCDIAYDLFKEKVNFYQIEGEMISALLLGIYKAQLKIKSNIE